MSDFKSKIALILTNDGRIKNPKEPLFIIWGEQYVCINKEY